MNIRTIYHEHANLLLVLGSAHLRRLELCALVQQDEESHLVVKLWDLFLERGDVGGKVRHLRHRDIRENPFVRYNY